MVGEVQERRGLAVLLAHEEQRHERREQHDAGGELGALEVDDRDSRSPSAAVADLVVVLREDDEVRPGEARRRARRAGARARRERCPS